MLCQALLLVGLFACASAGGAQYYVYATTADKHEAGTDSDIYIRIHGMKGVTAWFEMDLSGTNDFTRGDTDYYTFWRNEEVGEILCVEMHTGGSDALLVYKIKVKSSFTSWVDIYNTKGQWLSRDRDEGITQDKWCVDECAKDLPLTQGAWQLDSNKFDLPKAEITTLDPWIIESHEMNATDSTEDIETEYYASGYSHQRMTFTKTDGAPISGSLPFSTSPADVVDGAAVVDDSVTKDFTMGAQFVEVKAQNEWYACRAPAGKKVRCSARMDRVHIKVPFVQIWKRGSCMWFVNGFFERTGDGDLYQHIEEI